MTEGSRHHQQTGNPTITLICVGVVLLGVIAIGWYFSWQPKNSVAFITADTQIVTIRFSHREHWNFSNAILCQRSKGSRFTTNSNESENLHCTSDETATPLRGAKVVWPPNSLATITAVGNYIQIRIHANTTNGVPLLSAKNESRPLTFTKKTRLLVTNETMAKKGTLVFSGDVSIGQEAGAGPPSILQNGSYEFRELLSGRSRSVVVSKGDFALGDKVEIKKPEAGQSPNQTKSFISIPAGPTNTQFKYGTGFKLVSVTIGKMPTIMLNRIGFDPTEIKPSWTERMIANPLFGLFTVFIAMLAILPAIIDLTNLIVSTVQSKKEIDLMPISSLENEDEVSISQTDDLENLEIKNAKTQGDSIEPPSEKAEVNLEQTDHSST